jgi:quinol monooxygenase YgiN
MKLMWLQGLGVTLPLVVRDTSRIRPGRLEEVRAAFIDLARFVEANEPRVLLYDVSLDPEGSRVTVLQVHPDAASAEFHMEVGAPAFAKFAGLLELDVIEIYGDPGSRLLALLERKSDMLGGRGVVVHESLAGFARSSEPIP